MKKKLLHLLPFLLIGVFACSVQEESFPEITEEPIVEFTRISMDQAIDVANSYMDIFSGTETRTVSRQVAGVEVYGKDETFTRSLNGESADTLMYIIQFEGEGFALVAADTRLSKDLYGISPEGNFSLADTAQFPEMKLVLHLIDLDIRKDLQESSTRSNYLTGRDGRIWQIEERVEKFVNSQWDQGAPFNQYCFTTAGQQAVAGCVPIAISQIMYYYQHPKFYQSYDFNWNGIRLVTDKTAAMQYPAYASQAARLIREVGGLVRANYGVNSTGAYTETYAVSCFESMSYQIPTVDGIKGMYTYNSTRVKSGLSNYGPTLIRGTDLSGAGGHAWVLDGYMKLRDMTTGSTNMGIQEFVHCKWGWSYGMCDGYYFSGLFDLSEGAYFGSDGYSSSYDFRGGLKILPYIVPVAQIRNNNITIEVEEYWGGRKSLKAKSQYPVASNVNLSFWAVVDIAGSGMVGSYIMDFNLTLRKNYAQSDEVELPEGTFNVLINQVMASPSQDETYKYITPGIIL